MALIVPMATVHFEKIIVSPSPVRTVPPAKSNAMAPNQSVGDVVKNKKNVCGIVRNKIWGVQQIRAYPDVVTLPC